MLRVGSTITTEAWDTRYKSNNGWSHAWSASPAHIIPRKIMGIEPLAAGYEKIRIAPQPGDIAEAECKLPTIKGPVFVQFSQKSTMFNVNIEIPTNTTAQFVIPKPFALGKVIVDGMQVAPKYDEGVFSIDFGSGQHSVQVIDF